MKILELHLKRYGPFTDVSLDLSEGNPGLHVVFGPNEAGKSTLVSFFNGLVPHYMKGPMEGDVIIFE